MLSNPLSDCPLYIQRLLFINPPLLLPLLSSISPFFNFPRDNKLLPLSVPWAASAFHTTSGAFKQVTRQVHPICSCAGDGEIVERGGACVQLLLHEGKSCPTPHLPGPKAPPHRLARVSKQITEISASKPSRSFSLYSLFINNGGTQGLSMRSSRFIKVVGSNSKPAGTATPEDLTSQSHLYCSHPERKCFRAVKIQTQILLYICSH